MCIRDRSLTISTGVTVTCGLQTCYFVAQQFNNYGTIVNQNGAAGGGGGNGGGNGGTGGGAIIALTINSIIGTINTNGNGGGGASVPVSSGGAGGAGGTGNNSAGSGEPNGGGGGGGYNAAGGAGGVSIANSFANGNSMLTYIMQGVSDWWQINILAKSPSSTTPLLTPLSLIHI